MGEPLCWTEGFENGEDTVDSQPAIKGHWVDLEAKLSLCLRGMQQQQGTKISIVILMLLFWWAGYISVKEVLH